MVATVEGQRKSVMRQPLGAHTLASACRFKQGNRPRLQNAGADAAEDILLGNTIDDDIVNAGSRQQLPQEQTRRT
ncbi:hypothetical protein QO002_004559 [Pararhizobium capsulatum DSM 1112]|uniref:Uncharacterized protein n=1 Tax=Pararhizobium capsulatum DSM 1112 TaxID=1121113 RepID=A0ABU0BVR6_9HYPH|nr:hypothetical protein [Pararhizobium capsulatum DSM 1112]